MKSITKKTPALKDSAEFTTVLVGTVHFILPTRAITLDFENETIFFVIAGMIQIFWAFPIVKQWGNFWYYIGITGTSFLIVMWVLTKIPNPMIVRLLTQDVISGLPRATVEFNIIIEASQIAFVILVLIIAVN